MRWLTNMYDPTRDDFRNHVSSRVGESRDVTVYHVRKWLRDKVIGEPKFDGVSIAELKRNGMVGIYTR